MSAFDPVEIFSKVGIHSYTVNNWQEMGKERSSKKDEGGRGGQAGFIFKGRPEGKGRLRLNLLLDIPNYLA